ncbi:Regulatory protein RecX [Pseudomonas amygdali pv. lachrymans]|nr:Regulatory protein RecX [Pseudomonas amygdali pv. lachrymans]
MMRLKAKKLKDRAGLEGYALWMLAQRDMTRHLVKQKLEGYAQDRGDIEPVLERMEVLGYLDDRRFTEVYVRSCRDNRGYGPTKIRMKLKEKGVPNNLIQEFLDEKDECWAQKARELRERRFGEAPVDMVEKNRQMSFLARRGYSFDQIKQSFLAAEDHLA